MDVRIDSRDLAELEARVALAEAVSRIATTLGSCLNLESLVQEVVRSVKGLLGAEAATVILVDPETGDLVFEAAEGGAGEDVRSVRLKKGEGIAGWVADHLEAIAVPDVSADRRFTPRVDEETGFVTRTVVAAPLLLQGRLVGVLEAVNRLDGSRFGEAEARTLESLSPHVAVAVQNAGITARLVSRKEDLESEVRKRLSQIISAKKEWERTFDAIADPILIVDAGHTVRRANLAVASRSGLPIVEVPGKPCHEVAFGRRTPCPDCPLTSVLDGRIVSTTLEPGTGVFTASFFPIEDGEGQVYASVCTYHDVTAAKEMERRLQEVERMASVGQLAAGVAHEINNPMAFLFSNLGTLRGYFEDLSRVVHKAKLLAPLVAKASDAQLREVTGRFVQAITREADLDEILVDAQALLDESEHGASRVTHIVKQLKSFAREKRSEEEDMRLSDSVERAVHTIAAELPDAHVVVDTSTDRRIHACPMSIDQAVAALLRNAVQAAPDETVRVHIEDEGRLVRLVVEDEGAGIPEEVRGRIFDPFFTTRGVGGGLGLGLSTVYATVRQHKGVVRVEDRPGGGTRMILEIPAADGRGAPAGATADPVAAAANP